MQFAIEDRRTGRPTGLITAYEVDLFNGTAYVSLALLPEFRFRVWPLEGAILFANFLFSRFALRKLCGRSIGESFAYLQSGSAHFFEVEGVLKAHMIIDGSPQDMYLAAVDLERWNEIGVPLLRRIVT